MNRNARPAGIWRRLPQLAALALLVSSQAQAVVESFEGITVGPNISIGNAYFLVPNEHTQSYTFNSGLVVTNTNLNTIGGESVGEFNLGPLTLGFGGFGALTSVADVPTGTAFMFLNSNVRDMYFTFPGLVHDVSALVMGDTDVTISGYDANNTLVAQNSIPSVVASQWKNNLLSLHYAPGLTSVIISGHYVVFDDLTFDVGPPPLPGPTAEQTSAQTTGLPMANAENQAVMSGVQTVTNDINGHLFTLRSGGGEEESEGSIASATDDGVIVGQGDGPESPMARRIKRTRQWEAYATVNYGNLKLNPISNQAGVQVDSWASGVGIERHVSRSLTLGFALSFLNNNQSFTGGLGSVKMEGPALSTYLAYARKNVWASLLYSFGGYQLDSTRNPGLGFPTAIGRADVYTNALQFNTGYNFRFQNNTLVTGPFVGADYLHGTVDAYSETGGGLAALSYSKQTFQSLVSRVGWSASKKIHTGWADITPQVRLSYERQNLHNNGTSVSLISAPFTATGGNQSPGQDYMVVGAGVGFQFTPQLNVMLSYQTQIFRNNMEAHFGSVRLAYKF